MALLLVSNHTPSRHGGLFLLDTHETSWRRLLNVPIRGVTQGPDAFYCIENGGVIHRVAPGDWRAEIVAKTGLSLCHDLKWIDGRFYAVASHGNLVARLSPTFEVEATLRIVNEPKDICHPNCVAMINGEMMLAIFTLAPGSRESKRSTREGSEFWRHDGKVLKLNWAAGGYEVALQPFSQPHTLTWHGGEFYLCESFKSRILRVDTADGTRQEVCRLTGYVRGLAFDGDRAYVGISHRRGGHGGSPIRRWVSHRLSWCGVWEVSLPDWRPLRRLRCRGTQVYDLLLVED